MNMSTCLICRKTIKGKNIDHYVNHHHLDSFSAQAYVVRNEKSFRDIPLDVITEYLRSYGIILTRKQRHDYIFNSFYSTIIKFRPYKIKEDTDNFKNNVLPWRLRHKKAINCSDIVEVYFPGDSESQEKFRIYRKDKNPFTGHDAKLSPFSEKFIGYENVSAAEIKTTIRKITRRDDPAHNPTQINYWIKKGFSPDEAKDKVYKRQQTFSKTICIEKYGEEEGIKRFNERQEKWLQTLSNKPEEEIKRINESKLAKPIGPISRIEEEFLNAITTDKTTHNVWVQGCGVGDLVLKNKLIEFYGDYWHCNPRTYKKDFWNPQLHMTAKEKWDFDKKRIKRFEEKGYKIKIVWECDYKKDKDKIIKECVEFLSEKEA